MKKFLTIYNLEELSFIASELVYRLYMNRFTIDNNGNYKEYDGNITNESRFKYLNFKNCEELREISITEACDLSIDEIKEEYLSEIIPIARKSFREDNLLGLGMIAKSDIPDDFLDALFCIAWKNDLKIWSLNYEREREEEER